MCVPVLLHDFLKGKNQRILKFFLNLLAPLGSLYSKKWTFFRVLAHCAMMTSVHFEQPKWPDILALLLFHI